MLKRTPIRLAATFTALFALTVIALFGQGKLPLWAPSGPNSVVIAHQDDPDFYVCHPIDENAHLGQKFMNRITVEEVLAAAERIINRIENSSHARVSALK